MLNYDFIGVKANLGEHFVVKADFLETEHLVVSFVRLFVSVHELSHFRLAITLHVLLLIIPFEVGSGRRSLPGIAHKRVIIEA